MTNRRDIVVYIAGPYSAESKAEVFFNIGEAVRWATEVRQAGFSAIVPHLESFFCQDSLSEEQWLEHCLSLVKRCSAVLDTRQGRKSSGTASEVMTAHILGIPVVTSVYQLTECFCERYDEMVLAIGDEVTK